MINFSKTQIVLIILLVLFIQINNTLAVSDSIDVIQQVTGGCNNNGICEPEFGEDYENCSADCPAPQPPSGGGAVFFPDTTPPLIYDLSISKITLDSAEISWKTNEASLCQFFWGQSEEYKEGSISETTFYLKHLTKLVDLLPETTYHFKIQCRDTSQNESQIKDQKFITLTLPDVVPPANVSNFEAIPDDSQILLNWENPPESDFKGVKIIRSRQFYPTDPDEKFVVYNEKGSSFADAYLENDKRYYYTAFSYDQSGNYSSGAIVSAVPFCEIPPEMLPEMPPELPPEEVPLEIGELTIEDFHFIQNGQEIFLKESKLELPKEGNLLINIPYEKVPEVLKTIMVTLEKDGKFFSFLLRINQEKTFYEATIVLPEPGIYPLTLTILDYKNQTFKKIYGQIEIKGEIQPLPEPWYKKILSQFYLYIFFILLIILILILIIVILLSKKKKKEYGPDTET